MSDPTSDLPPEPTPEPTPDRPSDRPSDRPFDRPSDRPFDGSDRPSGRPSALLAADRRRIHAEPAPAAERDAAEAARDYLACRLRLARALAQIEHTRAYHLSSCSSIVQYGVRLGLPAAEARAIADLGRALAAPAERFGVRPSCDPADPATAQASGPTDSADIATSPVPGGTGASAACPDGVPLDGARAASADTIDTTTASRSATSHSPIEDAVLSGRIPVANAALLGRLVAQEGLVQPGEDWARRAATLRTSDLRRQVVSRIEEAAQGSVPLVSLTVHVSEQSREDFHRARVLASRECALVLTEGQAFTRIVRFYLDARDDCRRGAGGPRRAGGARPDAPGTRYVPADARRAVLDRSGDRCEVPGCALDTFLEFAHVTPHAAGGDRSAANLLRLCHVHHTQFDAECLVLAGWIDGRPTFRDARGTPIGTTPDAPLAAPRERADDLIHAVLDRRARAEAVSEIRLRYGPAPPVAPPRGATPHEVGEPREVWCDARPSRTEVESARRDVRAEGVEPSVAAPRARIQRVAHTRGIEDAGPPRQRGPEQERAPRTRQPGVVHAVATRRLARRAGETRTRCARSPVSRSRSLARPP